MMLIMILAMIGISHIFSTLMTLNFMGNRYSEEYAKMKKDIEDQRYENTRVAGELLKENFAIEQKVNAIGRSLDKIIQSQQGMENVVIASLIERIDILEQKVGILKEATKKNIIKRREV